MTVKTPLFYENFDESHCVQCSLRGIIEHFEPDQIWSWEKWDRFTDKEPDKWTWPYRALINAIKRGYDTIAFGAIIIRDYLEIGVYETLLKNLGKEAADACREHSNLENVKNDLVEYIALLDAGRAILHERPPTIEELKALLDDGFLLASALNSRILNNREGYASHVVLVYKIDSEFVYFHDSGPVAV